MNETIAKFIAIICVVGLVSTKAIAQQTSSAQEDTLSLDRFEIHSYVTVTRGTPDNVIKLDNNGEILLVCTLGKTVEQLNTMDIQFTQSQIRLLLDWRLLREEQGVLTTTFPILNADHTKHLRSFMKENASILGQNLREEMIALTRELQSIGREKNAYTILFSYILDDLVWDIWEEKSILPKKEITVEKPLWGGVVWAVYPPRDFSCGTNSISDKGVSLKVNWSEVAIKKMIPFVADWDNFSQMFDDFVEKGKVENKKAKQVFGPFNLFDSSGRFTVPVIVEKKDDALYQNCLSLSSKVSEQVLEVINWKKLKKELGFQDEEEALVVSYHELMWELLDYFEQQGLIQKPIAFANPEEAQSKDIGDLVFIVKQYQNR